MTIDPVKYIDTVNEFISRMENIPSVIHTDNDDIYAPVCKLLRIARIDTSYTEPSGSYNEDTIFGYKNPKTPFPIVRTETTRTGAVAAYAVYQAAGDAFWDDDEKRLIESFLKLVFIFNGRARAMSIAERLMFYDTDLEIANLSKFFRKVNMLISEGRIADYGACYFNIKRFSLINRTYGRDNGTRIMRRFVKDLSNLLDSKDEGVFRIGGDNFSVLFKKENLDKVKAYLDGTRIKADSLDSSGITITTNAGYYMCTGIEKSHNDVMDKISTAVTMAKTSSKETFFFFNEEAKKRIDQRKLIEESFVVGIEKREFIAFYQPKVDLATGKIIGAEALCRWIKDGRIVPPISFIPILEMSNAICTLDFYMLDLVCRDIRKWLDEGRKTVKVSVNLSRVHLGDEKLLDKVIDIIDKNNVPHEYIEIELTETTTDVDFGELRQIVAGLHKNGISASVDDFGIGYSSLTLIKELPWDVLKIDKSFLPDGSPNDGQKSIMLRHVISMAQGMGLECIVEGVETIEQVKLLRDFKCYHAQGFYFDKPLPKAEFEQKLEHEYTLSKDK